MRRSKKSAQKNIILKIAGNIFNVQTIYINYLPVALAKFVTIIYNPTTIELTAAQFITHIFFMRLFIQVEVHCSFHDFVLDFILFIYYYKLFILFIYFILLALWMYSEFIFFQQQFDFCRKKFSHRNLTFQNLFNWIHQFEFFLFSNWLDVMFMFSFENLRIDCKSFVIKWHVLKMTER